MPRVYEDAEELQLYADNTGELYPSKMKIIAEMKRWIDDGTYTHAKAMVLWRHWLETAAIRHRREINRDTYFTKATIDEAARDEIAHEKGRIERGEWGAMRANPLTPREMEYAFVGGLAIAAGLLVYAIWPKA